MNLRIRKTIAIAIFFISLGISAQAPTPGANPNPVPAEPKKDKPVESTPWVATTLKNATYKLDGVIFAGYNFNTHDTNGAAREYGPTSENTGFNVTRAYLTMSGKVNEGTWKDAGFQVTFDASGGSAKYSDGCASTCTQDNTYLAFLKYAYFDVPLNFLPGLKIRLGQQPTPVVDGQAGNSMTAAWGHRYIEVSAIEEIGFSAPTDRGLSLIYKNDYFGLHLLYGNGEAFKKNNAQGIPAISTGMDLYRSQTATTLSNGRTDSAGMDLYGMFTVRPTGAKKDLAWSINLPFRQYNIAGIDKTETNPYWVEKVGSEYRTYQGYGSERAMKDVVYGIENVLSYASEGGLKATLGLGHAVKKDIRGNGAVWYYTSNQYYNEVTTQQNFLSAFNPGMTGSGQANYVYGSVKFKGFGIVGKYVVGQHGSNTSTNTLAAPNGQSVMMQTLIRDSKDNRIGNGPTMKDARSNIDLGLGKFETRLVAITYALFENLDIAIGYKVKTTMGSNGKEVRSNGLDRVPYYAPSSFTASPSGTPTSSLSSLVETSVQNQLNSDYVTVNDLAGKQKKDTQVAIWSQFRF